MRKGRSKYLISERDKKLCRRFYYWTEVERRRFDDVVSILSNDEFYITEPVVVKIIREKYNKADYENDDFK